MWNALEHSDEENLRWSWLRAMEWASWPAFLSQVIAPVARIFTPWWGVLGGVLGLNVLWAISVRYRFISLSASYLGVFVTILKWVVCPAAAGYIVWKGHWAVGLLALLWPLVAIVISAIPPTQIGVLQKQFMAKLGYTNSEIGVEQHLGADK